MNTGHMYGLVAQHDDNNKDYVGVLWLVTLVLLRRSCYILRDLRETPAQAAFIPSW